MESMTDTDKLKTSAARAAEKCQTRSGAEDSREEVKCQTRSRAEDSRAEIKCQPWNRAEDYCRIPKIAVKPIWSSAAAAPVISLDGFWDVKHTDSLEWEVKYTGSLGQDVKADGKADIQAGWHQMEVPSDMNAHRDAGFTGKYVYKRMIEIPQISECGRIILKFEGVNGFAKVWIDGRAAASHKNGFVSWSADITELVKGKKEALLMVTVDETADRVCTYNHGGILHSVSIYCLPEAWLDGIYLTTSFEGGYEDAVLRADITISGQEEGDELLLKVYAPEAPKTPEKRGSRICGPIPGYELQITAQSGENGCSTAFIHMKKPYKWDAEHPWLYRLETSLIRGGKVLEKTERLFGVRQIERKENRLYVNGREVKLRGVCRHEITPKNGRAVTKEIIDQDISLFKEANCNYIRTSHYPPSEYFLEQCDRHGIYVEDELDLAFIAKNLDYTQRDPAYTDRYLSVFAEVLARDYSHPSVLIWSLANEAFGGYNYDLLNRFAHRMDPTRPTKFSYPMTMQAEHEGIDIWSIHYANVDGEPDKKCDNVSVGYTEGHDVPVLNDEFVHIPCYNRTEHRRDPNVRHFWGESLRLFWERIWETKGALGGAIWAGIDETDMFTETRKNVPMTKRKGDTCLEWGIIDIWRRKKPEHYMTRKAYTPALIREKTFKWADGCALIQMENRFCHTDLSEVRIDWKAVPALPVGAAEKAAGNPSENAGSMAGPPAAPKETALLSIPAGQSVSGQEAAAPQVLELKVFDPFGNQVDEYRLRPEGRQGCQGWQGWQENNGSSDIEADYLEQELIIDETEDNIEIGNDDFKFCFSKKTGLLTGAERGKELLLAGGPILHVPYLALGEWKLYSLSAKMDEGTTEAAVIIKGGYTDTADVTFTVRIRQDASFVTEYMIDRLYAAMPKEMKLRVGVDVGGLDELGVAYIAAPGMDSLTWKREGRYTVYPEDHIARLEGTAKRFSKGSVFAETPDIPWGQEMKNYILNGAYDVDYKGTPDFRGMKENIYAASLFKENGSAAVTAVSDGSCHVRAEVTEPEEYLVSDRDQRIKYNGTWYPVEDYHGSRGNTEMVSCEKGAYAEFTFSGTGIVWFGSVDTINGTAKVWMDGRLADGCINQKVAGVDFPGSAAGYDKKYGYPLYYVSGLPEGAHTIRIEVAGEKTTDSGGCYIAIDYFRVLTEGRPEPVRFAVLNDFNYPQISWGNYKKPAIRISSGYHNQVEMALSTRR